MKKKTESNRENYQKRQSLKRETPRYPGMNFQISPISHGEVHYSLRDHFHWPVRTFSVHPTEACADPRIEIFQGMAPVSSDLMKNRPR